MYILKETTYKLRKDLSIFNQSVESIFIEILQVKSKSTIIWVIYRPPKGNIQEFIDHFEVLVSTI